MGNSSGIKSFSEVAQSLIASILSKQPNANVTVGTFIRDLLVDVPAGEIASLYTQVLVAQQAQSISQAVGSHLERLLANYALYRRLGTKATGTVWFRTPIAPAADILIPAGTLVRTNMSLTQDAKEFVTTESVVMLVVAINTYYNPIDDVYEVSAPMQAVEIGISSNVGAYTLLDIIPSTLTMNIINKTATVGGTDEESDADLRARGLSVLMGSNVGTKDGYEILVEAIDGVQSTIVIDPNDTEMVRVKDGGGADVWIATSSFTEVTDTYDYTSGEVYHNMIQQPVKYVAAITENGNLLVPDYDYKFLRDSGVYERSIYSNDKVVWITNRTAGNPIVVTYGYGDVINTAQGIINDNKSHIVGVEVIAKLCYEATVNITMMIEVLSGYDPTIVANYVNGNVTSFIDALPLGNEIQQSDIVAIAEAVTGVDSVVLPLTSTSTIPPCTFTVTREISGITDGPDMLEGNDTGTDTSNLKIQKFEFAKPGTIIVNYYI